MRITDKGFERRHAIFCEHFLTCDDVLDRHKHSCLSGKKGIFFCNMNDSVYKLCLALRKLEGLKRARNYYESK